VRRLIECIRRWRTNKAAPLIDQALSDFPNDADMLGLSSTTMSNTASCRRLWTPVAYLVETSNVQNHLLCARVLRAERNKSSTEAATEGDPARSPSFGKPSSRTHSRPGEIRV
jgi:hypothetical protein